MPLHGPHANDGGLGPARRCDSNLRAPGSAVGRGKSNLDSIYDSVTPLSLDTRVMVDVNVAALSSKRAEDIAGDDNTALRHPACHSAEDGKV